MIAIFPTYTLQYPSLYIIHPFIKNGFQPTQPPTSRSQSSEKWPIQPPKSNTNQPTKRLEAETPMGTKVMAWPTGANCTGVTQPDAIGVPTSLPKPLWATWKAKKRMLWNAKQNKNGTPAIIAQYILISYQIYLVSYRIISYRILSHIISYHIISMTPLRFQTCQNDHFVHWAIHHEDWKRQPISGPGLELRWSMRVFVIPDL